MALLYMDGFDFWPAGNAGQRGWFNGVPASISNSNPATRFNYGSWVNPNGNSNAGISRALPGNVPTIYMGAAVYWNDSAARPLFVFWDGSTNTWQMELRCNTANQYYFTRNGTQVGSFASVNRVVNSWTYIEVGITFATGTGGSATLRINGQTVLTVTGVNTSNTGDAWCNGINFGNSSSWDFIIDDLYICDSTTSVNNNFLGDVRVYSLMPNGAGSSTQWTPNGAASNYQCVNTTPTATTDYVSSATAGQLDLYTVQQIAAAQSIDAVQVTYYAEKTDSGTRIIESVVKSGSAQATGAQNALGTSFAYYSDIFNVDPNTSAAWTLAAINAMQIGLEEVV